MLRMQPFNCLYPKTVEETARLLFKHKNNVRICAGGTDILPNIKHELLNPEYLVSLSRLKELSYITSDKDSLVIGAMTSLENISNSNTVLAHAPSLADATKHIASPQIRQMGTIGGNICLDTRCLYLNQTYFWREALGFCIKKDGTACHVTKTGKRCVAAASNDAATCLLSLDAQLEILSHEGKRQISLKDFYVAEGKKNNCLNSNDLLLAVRLPKRSLASPKRIEGFAKLRHRESIDFPMLSVSVSFDLDQNKLISKARVTINALVAKPKMLATDWLLGRTLNQETIAELAQYAKSKCSPMSNICDDPNWRKNMIPVYINKAVSKALEMV